MRTLSVGFVLAFLGLAATAIPSIAGPEVVRLLAWEGPARLISSPGVGVEQFRLRAQADWAAGQSRDPERFRIQLEGPGGRVSSQRLSDSDAAGGRWVTAHVPADWVRNLRPGQVSVTLTVVNASSARAVSNVLKAGIDDFPRPTGSLETADPGPFGWGEPAQPHATGVTHVPRPAPSGLAFLLVPRGGRSPLLLATTEVSIDQMQKFLPAYDPRQGRSDEFNLEDRAQPAVGVTPNTAATFLKALSAADPAGLTYRLPTVDEWRTAALAGKNSIFWWGDSPTFPAGANLIGSEPGLMGDTTAEAAGKGFRPNPWGLFHTVGNVGEWATDPQGRHVRLGGHFRSELDGQVPQAIVADPASTGPDPYVGLRVAADLDPRRVVNRARELLSKDARLSGVSITFDPARLALTLTGTVEKAADRRRCAALLEPIWVASAVVDQLALPTFPDGQLARIGKKAGRTRRITPLGRWLDELPVSVKWADPLPVRGSEWWLNIFLSDGSHYAHRLIDDPTPSGTIVALIDLAKVRKDERTVTLALSLGAAASSKDDPRIVSNLAEVNRD